MKAIFDPSTSGFCFGYIIECKLKDGSCKIGDKENRKQHEPASDIFKAQKWTH